MLDHWFRDVCFHYRNMPSNARTLLRQFLNFDMTRPKDIFIQDQLTWGTIEMLDSHEKMGPVLIVQRAALNSMPDQFLDELETITNPDPASGRSAVVNSKASRRGSAIAGASNSHLQDLIWESASQGGNSKLHSTKAAASRKVIKLSAVSEI